MIVLGLAMAALCGVFFVLGCNLAWIGQRLDADGVTTSATIVAKDERSIRGNPKSGQPEYRPDYFVTYRFTTSDGTAHFNEVGVSPTFFLRSAIGGSTPVRYLAENPKRSEVEFGHTGASSFRALVFGGLGALLGAGILVSAVFRPQWLEL